MFRAEHLWRLREIKGAVGSLHIHLGNHDLEAMYYLPYVTRIRNFMNLRNAWLSHAPIHPDELRGMINVHGHVHSKTIKDDRYVNVCCENTNYRPIDWHSIKDGWRTYLQE